MSKKKAFTLINLMSTLLQQTFSSKFNYQDVSCWEKKNKLRMHEASNQAFSHTRQVERKISNRNFPRRRYPRGITPS